MKVTASRNKGTETWVAVLEHHGATINLYEGKSGNAANDIADALNPVLVPGVNFVYRRVPEGDKKVWNVFAENGKDEPVAVESFGTLANPAADFADALNKVLATPEPI